MKRCLIIGHRGQDGRLLAEKLGRENADVIGIGRGDLDILDAVAVRDFISESRPEEIYYLAAFHQSSEDQLAIDDTELFRRSFGTHVHGLISFLEAMRREAPTARLFYAASSHVFGQPDRSPQNEDTPFRPRNIYGLSKAAGVEACRFYRRVHGLYATSGILYNHESRYRAKSFVSEKIIGGATSIFRGEQTTLTLGNLDAEIDWGYAPDTVEAMTRILALEAPDDFVVATGESHSVREFVELVFGGLGLDWQSHVKVDPGLLAKPITTLVGDASKLRALTGWKPSVSFSGMVDLLLTQKPNLNH